jgi:hypothetical protein
LRPGLHVTVQLSLEVRQLEQLIQIVGVDFASVLLVGREVVTAGLFGDARLQSALDGKSREVVCALLITCLGEGGSLFGTEFR